MTRRKINNLYVYMNDVLVGILKRTSNNLVFEYDNHWLNFEYTRPISLSMPLREKPYTGQIVENYFDNLLPDNRTIRERIQATFGISSNHCFDLLSFIGKDCVGAIQILTEQKNFENKTILAKPLDRPEIATILKHYRTNPLGMDLKNDFRISIAGAQEKTAFLWYDQKWNRPIGSTPTSHIFKLPIGFIQHSGIDLSDSVENEWLCLKILSFFQVPVNDAKIEFFEDVKSLVVERFDRHWSLDNQWLMRIPQEDMCQALNFSSALKYESDGGPGILNIMKILNGSKDANLDRHQFMKSVFLFWVMGAIDGHAKNFSLRLEPLGRYKLTPLYDVISAYPIAKRQLEWQKLKMAMSVKGKNRHYLWHSIQIQHWLEMADYCQFSRTIMQNIIDEIFDNMEIVITKVSNVLPKHFSEELSQAIFNGMRKIKDKK